MKKLEKGLMADCAFVALVLGAIIYVMFTTAAASDKRLEQYIESQARQENDCKERRETDASGTVIFRQCGGETSIKKIPPPQNPEEEKKLKDPPPKKVGPKKNEQKNDRPRKAGGKTSGGMFNHKKGGVEKQPKNSIKGCKNPSLINGTPIQNTIVRYMYRRSKGDMDFVKTMIAENPSVNPKPVSRPNRNKSQDYGIGQFNSKVHWDFISSPDFQSWKAQVDHAYYKVWLVRKSDFKAYAIRDKADMFLQCN